jgi:bla regulator protein BlaR1
MFQMVPPAGPLPDHWPAMVFSVWVLGLTAYLVTRGREWMRLRRMVMEAGPVDIEFPVPVKSSVASMEPGVIGIFRPVLLLPERIWEDLTPRQLRAILAHEACHVERRDNLTAALHMLVEAIFWFHPLVWWIERRLLAERERACDEQVLRMGSEREDYAEGILKVCKVCIASRLACVSGVTGADLKGRIREIMTCGIGDRLNHIRKVLLAAAAAIAVAGPVVFGVLSATQARGQSSMPLAFEVASIKHSNPDGILHAGMQYLPGGRFTARNTPLYMTIASAYNLPFQTDRLTGGPQWLHTEGYDIEAIAPRARFPLGHPPEPKTTRCG